MSFFRRKKRFRPDKPFADLNTLLSEGKIERLKGGDLQQEDLKIELFHVGGLMDGYSESRLDELETGIFGKSFKQIYEEGYQPSIAIRDDDGNHWTAVGKIKAA